MIILLLEDVQRNLQTQDKFLFLQNLYRYEYH